jgi:GTP cyclohydrolase I
VLEAEHLCMSLRGVGGPGPRTGTSTLAGRGRTPPRSPGGVCARTGAAT